MINMHPLADNFVCLDNTNSEFVIKNGIAVTHRATILITPECPLRTRSMLIEALNEGWLKPIAYMKESEYLIAKLSNND